VHERERGSVLALLPAAVLVFIVLGSLAVDASMSFLGERQVANLASAIANDAATQGIDVIRYYRTGEIVVDPARVRDVADAALASAGLDHLDGLTIETDVIGDDRVVVRVRAHVRSLFSRVLPQGLESREVQATAEAVAERG
jgi:hypothetical protein